MSLTHDEALQVSAAFLRKWHEVVLQELERDRASLEDVDAFQQIYLRAKWHKWTDLILGTGRAIARYKTDAGQLDLVGQIFGDQLGIPAKSLTADIAQRREWYKERFAASFERDVDAALNAHTIESPVEQIFLMEWKFQRVEEKHSLKLTPHVTIETDAGKFELDFVVSTKASASPRIALELDGHEFHERTRDQAIRDRTRERAITRQGFTVVRFTGSEIVRNPRKCVEEVITMMTAQQSAIAEQ